MLRPLCLLALLALAACTSFNAVPTPVPRSEIAPAPVVARPVVAQPVVPSDIRPLTEDQRAMLDG